MINNKCKINLDFYPLPWWNPSSINWYKVTSCIEERKRESNKSMHLYPLTLRGMQTEFEKYCLWNHCRKRRIGLWIWMMTCFSFCQNVSTLLNNYNLFIDIFNSVALLLYCFISLSESISWLLQICCMGTRTIKQILFSSSLTLSHNRDFCHNVLDYKEDPVFFSLTLSHNRDFCHNVFTCIQ